MEKGVVLCWLLSLVHYT